MSFWFSALSAFASVQGGADRPLSLDEAIALAEKSSFSVLTSLSALEKAKQRANEASGNMGPRVSLGASYSRYDEKTVGGGSTGGGSGGAIDSKNANATVSMPIDVVGVLGRLKRASEKSVQAAELNLRATKQDLRLAVKKSYLTVLRSKAVLSVFEQSLENAKQRLSKAQVQLREDSIAPVDVLRFETLVRSAEGDLAIAKNTVRLTEQAFNLTLARPIDTPVTLADVAAVPTVDGEPSKFVGYGLKVRPEVQALEANLYVLKEITEAQRGGLLPSLSVSMTHQRFIDSIGPTGRDNQTTATLSVGFPIFDSGITKSKVRQSKEDEKAVQIQIDQVRLAISLEVRSALNNVASARERVDTAERQVKLATEVLRIANVRSDAGEGIFLEVIDAQTQLTQAQNALVSARYDYLTSYSELQRAVGSDDLRAAAAAGNK